MLAEIKFAAQAFAANHPQMFLRYIRIHAGRVIASNGVLTIAVPVDVDISVCADGEKLLRAIAQFKDVRPNVYVTDAGRLALKHKKLCVFVPCATDAYPFPTPEGTELKIDDPDDFLAALSDVSGIADSRSPHAWAQGILLRDSCAFATDSRVAVQRWLGVPFPRTINLPLETAALLVKLKLKPARVLCDKNSITFFLDGGAYIRSALLRTDWPDIAGVIETAHRAYAPDDFHNPGTLASDLAQVVAATGAQAVGITRETTTAVQGDATAQIATGVPCAPAGAAAVFNAADLARVLGIASRVAFQHVPAHPGVFLGAKLRGAVVGCRT